MDQLNLIIPLNHPLCPQVIFNIKKKERQISESINELYEIIKKQQKEFNDLRTTINEQQIEIKKLNEIIKESRDNQQKILDGQDIRINKLEEKLKEVENSNEYRLFSKSKIIRNEYKKEEKLKEWINPNKEINFKLLFRKTRDGSNGTDFHRYCDNKGPTLILIETNKGKIFGGYTPINLESPDYQDKIDDLTFIFSLNSMTKFTKYKEGYSIRLNKDFGPIFGTGHDFYLNQDMNLGYCNNGNYLRNRELKDGEEKFKVKEIEIYKVEFN